jgi:hypothetical protein
LYTFWKKKEGMPKVPSKRITHKRQNSTTTDNVSKIQWITNYKDPFEMKDKPISNNTITRLAIDMLEHCKNEKVLSIGSFFVQKGVPESTWRAFSERCDAFRVAYEMAKSMIAIRRFEGVTYGKLKPDMIKFNQGQFDTDWRNEQLFQAQLAKEVVKPEIQRVVIPDFGTTDIVKKVQTE